MRLSKLFFIPFSWFGTAVILASCAHQSQPTSAPLGAKVQEIPSFRTSDPEPPAVADQELEQIPVEINPKVEQWIQYFQGKGRPHMERYLARSTRYSGLMKRILRQNGLPEDLIYVALIESGFSSKATSRAAAVGYWQFIKGTARRYGMEINPLIDERRDPVLSTQAAADYFKGLYSVFGSWYLSMASYNVGENRVKKEVVRNSTRDFWELARKKRFPKETVNYVPKFLAAKIIGKNPEKYGFTEIDYEKPIEFELVQLKKPVNLKTLAQEMSLDYDELKRINPKFRGEIAPLKGNVLDLRVPVGQTKVALAAAEKSFVDQVVYIADAGETETYKIRKGDSLYTIARKFKTTVAWLRDTNDLKSGRKLRIGQKLQVPDRGLPSTQRSTLLASNKKSNPVIAAKVASVNPAAASIASVTKVEDQEKAKETEITTKDGVYYIVQSGDTLSAIAEDYDSTVKELRKMNKLGRGAVLRLGMKLKVPKDEGLPVDPEVSPSINTPLVVSGAAAPAAPPAPPAPTAQIVTEQVAAVSSDGLSHVVRSGENLSTIAKKYGVSVQAIQKVNNLTRRSVLKVGYKLIIPADGSEKPMPSSVIRKASEKKESVAFRSHRKTDAKARKIHIVRKGESLKLIAQRYQVSLQKLQKANRWVNPSKLFVGVQLMIPQAHAR